MLVLCAGLPLRPTQAAIADDLKALVESNQTAAAYSFGLAHSEELGQPEFDFYFGIAAIDQGHAGEGVLALERYVLLFPANLSARAQLARGYFALGDDARARDEFVYIQKRNPSEDVLAVIDRYLAALEERRANYATTSSAYVEAGLGFDNNANSGASSADISVPVLGSVTLQPGGLKVGSWYQSLSAGGQLSTALAPGLSVLAGATIDDKENDNRAAAAYSTLSYGGKGGLAYLRGDNLFHLIGGATGLDLDGTDYLRIAAISGDVTHQIDELQSITGALQYARLRYPTQTVRDSEFSTLDVSYRRAFSAQWDPVLSVGATYGEERNTQADNLARHIYGARIDGSFTPLTRWVVSAGLGFQESNYGGPEPLLLVNRRDHYGSLDLLASYQCTKQLSIRAEALVSTNRSNLALYAYDRDVLAVKVHYDLK
jgi:hypothetical protein